MHKLNPIDEFAGKGQSKLSSENLKASNLVLSYYEKVMFGYNFLNVVGNVGYACRLTVNFCQGVNLVTREGPNVSTRRQRLSSARTQNPINIYYFVTRNISWRYRSCLDILTTCWNRLGNRLQWKRSRNSQNGASPRKKKKKKTPLFAPRYYGFSSPENSPVFLCCINRTKVN